MVMAAGWVDSGDGRWVSSSDDEANSCDEIISGVLAPAYLSSDRTASFGAKRGFTGRSKVMKRTTSGSASNAHTPLNSNKKHVPAMRSSNGVSNTPETSQRRGHEAVPRSEDFTDHIEIVEDENALIEEQEATWISPPIDGKEERASRKIPQWFKAGGDGHILYFTMRVRTDRLLHHVVPF